MAAKGAAIMVVSKGTGMKVMVWMAVIVGAVVVVVWGGNKEQVAAKAAAGEEPQPVGTAAARVRAVAEAR